MFADISDDTKKKKLEISKLFLDFFFIFLESSETHFDLIVIKFTILIVNLRFLIKFTHFDLI